MAYTMMYLCQNLIDCQKRSKRELIPTKLLTGLCLLALELSRHRTTSHVADITIEEQNWIYKVFLAIVIAIFSLIPKKSVLYIINVYLDDMHKSFQVEIHIGEYLRKKEEEAVQAVALYLDALMAVGVSWYNGEYPLVLMDNLVFQWIKARHSFLLTKTCFTKDVELR